jgi:hypothetical protein
MSKVALPIDAPETLKVWSKSVPNEGYFTLETERVSRHYLASHCSWVTEAWNLAHSTHVRGGGSFVDAGVQ